MYVEIGVHKCVCFEGEGASRWDIRQGPLQKVLSKSLRKQADPMTKTPQVVQDTETQPKSPTKPKP